MTNDETLARLSAALRDVAGTCSDSTSLNDALRRVADKLSAPARVPGSFPGHYTYCKHCEKWRDARDCRADPYINAEPREYCPVATQKG
jgi:hypothetical protein